MQRTILIALLGLSSTALANPFDVYGASPRAIAMGNATNAGSKDGSAVFYNPSGLGFLKSGEFQLQVISYNPNLTVQRFNENSTIEEVIPQSDVGINVVTALPLTEKLTVGAALFVPGGSRLFAVQSLDPVVPQFYYYQSLYNRFEMIPGVAFRPIPQISLGAATTISTKLVANFNGTILGIDPNTQSTLIQRDLTADGAITASPIIGLTIAPIEELQIGVTFRGANDGSLNIKASIDTGQQDLADVALEMDTSAFFIPNTLSFGVAGQLTPEISLQAGLDYALWSQAPNPETFVATTVIVNDQPLLTIDTAEVPLNFRNVFVPRAGVEVDVLPELALRAGYFFRPTHVPNQNSAASNFLDSNVSTLSLGAGYTFKAPPTISKNPIRLDTAYQLQAVSTAAAGKEDPNDPVGNVGFGGSIHTFVFSVAQEF